MLVQSTNYEHKNNHHLTALKYTYVQSAERTYSTSLATREMPIKITMRCHLHPRLGQSESGETDTHLPTLLGRVRAGAATFGNRLAFPQRLPSKGHLGPSSFTPSHARKRTAGSHSNKNVCLDVQSSVSHNSQRWKQSTCPPTDGQMNVVDTALSSVQPQEGMKC